MEDTIVLAIAGLASLVALELMAMHKGINGKLMTTVVTAIGVVVGFGFGKGL